MSELLLTLAFLGLLGFCLANALVWNERAYERRVNQITQKTPTVPEIPLEDLRYLVAGCGVAEQYCNYHQDPSVESNARFQASLEEFVAENQAFRRRRELGTEAACNPNPG